MVKKTLALAVLGAFGAFAVPQADARDHDSCRSRRSYRAFRLTVRYEHRHCGRCVPRVESYWVDTGRWEFRVVGYDGCTGEPILEETWVPCGTWETRTVYFCR